MYDIYVYIQYVCISQTYIIRYPMISQRSSPQRLDDGPWPASGWPSCSAQSRGVLWCWRDGDGDMPPLRGTWEGKKKDTNIWIRSSIMCVHE